MCGTTVVEVFKLIYDTVSWLQVVDYGVHKLWEYNNVGVLHLLPLFPLHVENTFFLVF